MKRSAFLIVFLALPLWLNAQIKTAQAYYDYITDHSIQVELALVNFANALESDSAALMYETLNKFEEKCAAMVSYMETLEPFRNHVAWRDATKDLYSFYLGLCKNEYVQLICYSLRIAYLTEEEFNQYADMTNKVTAVEIEKVNAVNMAKDDFLQKFGPVKIRERKEDNK